MGIHRTVRDNAEEMAGQVFGLERRDTETRRVPAGALRNTERTVGGLFYELGEGHKAEYKARGDSDRRKDRTGDGD